MSDDLALDVRAGLPDALRALVGEFPREAWEAHGGFGPLTRFWLERHGMFRRLLDAIERDGQLAVDGRMDGRDHATRVSRLGGMFVGGLHEHHHVEDDYYFPRLRALHPAVAQGFDILDSDHHALDAQLAGFTDAANALLQGVGVEDGARDRVGRFLERVALFRPALDRHLVDEEEIIVPVLLKYGEAAVGG